MQGRTVYRRRSLTAIWVGCFGVLPVAVGLIGMLYGAGVLGKFDQPHIREVVLYGGLLLLGLVAGVRSWLVSIVVTPRRLLVRNFLWTHRLPWPRIRAIEEPRLFQPHRTGGLRFFLDDGSTVTASAFAPAGWDPPGFADETLTELQSALMRHRGGGRRPRRRR